MQNDIQTRKVPLTDALRRHVERRLGFARSSKGDAIEHVIVGLSVINDPRGGADKRCNIQVKIPHQPDEVIVDTKIALYIAIDREADHSGQAVARQLERQRELSRTAMMSTSVSETEIP